MRTVQFAVIGASSNESPGENSRGSSETKPVLVFSVFRILDHELRTRKISCPGGCSTRR